MNHLLPQKMTRYTCQQPFQVILSNVVIYGCSPFCCYLEVVIHRFWRFPWCFTNNWHKDSSSGPQFSTYPPHSNLACEGQFSKKDMSIPYPTRRPSTNAKPSHSFLVSSLVNHKVPHQTADQSCFTRLCSPCRLHT